MNCPPEIALIVLRILRTGILRSRQAAWSGNSRLSAVEADHIHNLPELLAHYSSDLLQFYWTVERPAFMSQCSPADLHGFEPLWQELSAHTRELTPRCGSAQ